jgi:hypothetical protein
MLNHAGRPAGRPAQRMESDGLVRLLMDDDICLDWRPDGEDMI